MPPGWHPGEKRAEAEQPRETSVGVTNRQLVVVAGVFAIFLTAVRLAVPRPDGHAGLSLGSPGRGPDGHRPADLLPGWRRDARRQPPGPAAGCAADRRSARVLASLGVVTAAYLISGLVGSGARVGVRARAAGRRGVVRVGCATTSRRGCRRHRHRGRGSARESALSAIGEFDYLAPDLLGVPWWLFPLYLHGALVAADIVALVRSTASRSVPAGRRT